MSAPKVDVLAVMDAAENMIAGFNRLMGDDADTTPQQMRQARAAVAELVEAAREGAAECAYFASAYDHAEKTRDRLRAALAKIEAQP